MISDIERREVARRLRELEKCVIGALIPIGELAENILRAIDYGYSGAMTPYGRLADLIEPIDSAQTVAEDMFGQMRHPTEQERVAYADMLARNSVELRPVDRDALLALADEMSDTSCDNYGELSVSLGDIWGWSQAIRDALGVQDA